MARSHEDRAEEKRQEANEAEADLQALEDLKNELLEADRIGDTRLSKLFHEARTSRKNSWKTVSAFVKINDEEAEVVEINKLSDGRWAPDTVRAFDAIISVPVRPFMESDIFRSLARDSLSQEIAGHRQKAQDLRRSAKDHERLAEREA